MTNQGQFNTINREFFKTDEFAIKVRKEAQSRVKRRKFPKLLSVNPKVIKGEKYGYKTAILHLAPSWFSGYNVCPFAKGCGKVCLTFSGRGQLHMISHGIHHVHIARTVRTLLWFEQRELFKTMLIKEIKAHIRASERADAKPVVRLNGTSDIEWESVWPEVFAMFPQVIFYDYAKKLSRAVDHIPNYSLTLSHQEGNDELSKEALSRGKNVAVVLRLNPRKKDPMPKTLWGFKVIDGDESDLRFTDEQGAQGVIVGLRSKGSAFKDTSGFVVDA